MTANHKIENVYMFGIIGVFILLIACINFMNMATAKGITRAKEIGIRKVIGAHKSQLVFQFLSESIIISAIAFLLAFAIMIYALDTINYLLDTSFTPQQVMNPGVVGAFIVITIFTGIISGSYPALVLSAYKPSHTLRGTFKNTAKGQLLRKGLVVFQFTISINFFRVVSLV